MKVYYWEDYDIKSGTLAKGVKEKSIDDVAILDNGKALMPERSFRRPPY